MPRLGEFISIASKHGVKKKHGPADLCSDHVLKRDTVAVWCETLGLPPEDFGLPPYQAP
jgi:hypothetical protein